MTVPAVLSIVILSALPQGGVRLGHPVLCSSNDDLLQYDDGTAYWLTWSGLYRGVWWDLEDFCPGMPGCNVCEMEYWFYHHASYPWDTSAFYAELCDGTPVAPTAEVWNESVTAVHYAPCHAQPDDVFVYDNFWSLVNTEMSAGGWPSLLGDNTPQSVSHSFFSDDFVEWQPWIMGGATANDFFVRIGIGLKLTESTWGGSRRCS